MMKQLMLFLCFLLPVTLSAQKAASKHNEVLLTEIEGPYLVPYIEHQSLNGKIKVYFFYEYEQYNLVDDRGKTIKFSSRTEVLNYFFSFGWVFEEVYNFPSGSTETLVFRKKKMPEEKTSDG